MPATAESIVEPTRRHPDPGRAYTTDSRGEITLAENAPWDGLLDVDGPNILDRQTLVRSSTGSTLTVWPTTTKAGVDPHYISILVYASASISGGDDGAWPLTA